MFCTMKMSAAQKTAMIRMSAKNLMKGKDVFLLNLKIRAGHPDSRAPHYLACGVTGPPAEFTRLGGKEVCGFSLPSF